jgi:drug/metabolite transporter (DMT)-like permease
MKIRPWLIYAVITTLFWGVWGALIDLPRQKGFPETLGYVVWALTMIPPALVALKIINWKLEHDKKSILLGCIIGFTGAGGQLILFHALKMGPAYLIFPFISMSPVVTIIFAYIFLKERASKRGRIGIILALLAILLLSFQPEQLKYINYILKLLGIHLSFQSTENSVTSGYLWIILSLIVFLAWGFQAYVMRFANNTMKAESIFFYMMLTGLILIPVALLMTDFSNAGKGINWGISGPWLAAGIQILNSVGALMIVYAFRFGKAIIVSPLTNAVAPVITIIISLTIYQIIPHPVILSGMILALISIFLMAIENSPEEPAPEISKGNL